MSSISNDSLVIVEKKGAVATIILNRAEAMNALSKGLRDGISKAFYAIQADSDIRAAVLIGTGKAFCAGFDLKELSSGLSDNAAEAGENEMATAIADFEGPVIAAVNGPAITGGFELALACDMIIASENARFADTHARVGILPGWGLSQRLPRLIGIARAKELSFTGNQISASQAYDWGLVNRVVEAEDLRNVAEALAEDMCSCVPAILKQYKKLIDDGYSMPFNEALSYEAELGIESAKAASAAMVASVRKGVVDRGRNQKKSD